jgi:electron transport complex protein RnfG
MQQNSPLRIVLTLVVFCSVAAGGLSLTYAVTKDQIEAQKRIEEAKAYSLALPAVKTAEGFTPLGAVARAIRAKHKEVTKVLKGEVDGDLKGYVIVVGPRGYGGPVQMAVGLTPDGAITNVAVISSNETMGLGTKALEPAFIRQLAGKTARDPVQIGKDIDAITGATRSSNAVVTGAREAVDVYKDFIRR